MVKLTDEFVKAWLERQLPRLSLWMMDGFTKWLWTPIPGVCAGCGTQNVHLALTTLKITGKPTVLRVVNVSRRKMWLSLPPHMVTPMLRFITLSQYKV